MLTIRSTGDKFGLYENNRLISTHETHGAAWIVYEARRVDEVLTYGGLDELIEETMR